MSIREKLTEFLFPPPVPPPVTATLLKDLLDDAKITAAYTQRAGLLSNTTLITAISNAEKVSPLLWSSPEAIALQIALNDTMSSLYPTTLDSLKGPNPPFTETARGHVATGFLMILTMIFALLAATITLQFNYGSSIADDLVELKDSRIHSTIRSTAIGIYNKIRTEDEINAETYTTFMEKMSALTDDTIRIESTMNTARKFIVSNNIDMIFQYLPPFSRAEDSAVSTPSEPAAPPQSPGGSCGSAGQPNEVIRISASLNQQDLRAISCELRIIEKMYYYPDYDRMMAEIRATLNAYGLWLLPALYGSLGGLAYYMRRAINPVLPNPNVSQVLTRMVLAFTVGIIIASLWAQTIQANDVFKNSGLSLFAVCFIVGYSLNVFFHFLDRMVATVRLGTRRGPGPESGDPPPPSGQAPVASAMPTTPATS